MQRPWRRGTSNKIGSKRCVANRLTCVIKVIEAPCAARKGRLVAPRATLLLSAIDGARQVRRPTSPRMRR